MNNRVKHEYFVILAFYRICLFLFSILLCISCEKDSNEISNDREFSGKEGSFSEFRDRRTYNWVKIDNKIWMAEKLNFVTSNGSLVYNNDPSYAETYGRLYDWETACKVCPDGWHLPSDNEWKKLEIFLGMSPTETDETDWRGTDEGGKIKESGIMHWESNNEGATNSSGFNALPGGFRYIQGSYMLIGDYGKLWTSTTEDKSFARYRDLSCFTAEIKRAAYLKNCAFSVRCIKD